MIATWQKIDQIIPKYSPVARLIRFQLESIAPDLMTELRRGTHGTKPTPAHIIFEGVLTACTSGPKEKAALIRGIERTIDLIYSIYTVEDSTTPSRLKASAQTSNKNSNVIAHAAWVVECMLFEYGLTVLKKREIVVTEPADLRRDFYRKTSYKYALFNQDVIERLVQGSIPVNKKIIRSGTTRFSMKLLKSEKLRKTMTKVEIMLSTHDFKVPSVTKGFQYALHNIIEKDDVFTKNVRHDILLLNWVWECLQKIEHTNRIQGFNLADFRPNLVEGFLGYRRHYKGLGHTVIQYHLNLFLEAIAIKAKIFKQKKKDKSYTQSKYIIKQILSNKVYANRLKESLEDDETWTSFGFDAQTPKQERFDEISKLIKLDFNNIEMENMFVIFGFQLISCFEDVLFSIKTIQVDYKKRRTTYTLNDKWIPFVKDYLLEENEDTGLYPSWNKEATLLYPTDRKKTGNMLHETIPKGPETLKKLPKELAVDYKAIELLFNIFESTAEQSPHYFLYKNICFKTDTYEDNTRLKSFLTLCAYLDGRRIIYESSTIFDTEDKKHSNIFYVDKMYDTRGRLYYDMVCAPTDAKITRAIISDGGVWRPANKEQLSLVVAYTEAELFGKEYPMSLDSLVRKFDARRQAAGQAFREQAIKQLEKVEFQMRFKIAYCLELICNPNVDNNSISMLTIEFDHTSSGPQILGTIQNDKSIALATNALEEVKSIVPITNIKVDRIETTNQQPLTLNQLLHKNVRDFYMEFCNAWNLYRKDLPIEYNVLLTRADTKKYIVGLVYGRGFNKSQIICASFLIQNKKDKRQSWVLAAEMSDLLKWMYPSFYAYINTAKKIGRRSPTIEWNFFDGAFLVQQQYWTLHDLQVKTRLSTKSRSSTYIQILVVDEEGNMVPDVQKNSLGLAPNFIHSLDAELLWRNVIDLSQRNIFVGHIHDSYIVNPNNALELIITSQKNFRRTTCDGRKKWCDLIEKHLPKQKPPLRNEITELTQDQDLTNNTYLQYGILLSV